MKEIMEDINWKIKILQLTALISKILKSKLCKDGNNDINYYN